MDGSERAQPASTAAAGSRRRWWVDALLVAAVALAVRLVYLAEIRSSVFFDVPLIDAQTYHETAQHLAAGAWRGPPRPFWQPPLYPYLLGLLYAAGGGLLAARIVQLLLGAASALLITRLGQWAGGRTAGLFAGLCAAFYGTELFFEGRLLPPALLLFLNALGLLLFVRALDARRRRAWLAPGLVFGLATVARPDAFVVVLALAAGLLVAGRGRRPLPALLFLLAACLPVVPVTARNLMTGGDLVWVSSNGGINFYLGNNPHADATVALRPGREWRNLVETPHREAGLRRASARSRYFYRRAFDFMRAQPGAAAAGFARKAVRLLSAEEIHRNEDPYALRRESRLLSILLWRTPVLSAPWGLVGPLALLGAALAWPRRRRLWPFYLYGAAYAAAIVAFFVTARYRLPLLPVALAGAGLGAGELQASGQQPRRLRFWLVATAALAVLLNANAAAPRRGAQAAAEFWRLRAIAEYEHGAAAAAVAAQARALRDNPGAAELHFDLGVYREAATDTAGAVAAYRRALELAPDYAEAMVNLGLLLAHADSTRAAVGLLLRAAAVDPDLVPAQIALAGAFLHSGHADSALAHYARAIALDPGQAAAWSGRGGALRAAGRPAAAVVSYRRALALGGETPAALRGLGNALRDAGELEEALVTLRRALRPADDPRTHVALGQVYVRLQRLDDAERQYKLALAAAPRLIEAHNDLGDVYARRGLYDRAQASFDRALAIDPANATALYNQAVVEVQLGNPWRAVMFLERLVENHPEHALGRQALARLRAGPAAP